MLIFKREQLCCRASTSLYSCSCCSCCSCSCSCSCFLIPQITSVCDIWPSYFYILSSDLYIWLSDLNIWSSDLNIWSLDIYIWTSDIYIWPSYSFYFHIDNILLYLLALYIEYIQYFFLKNGILLELFRASSPN